jgi:hypothetical protein
MKEILKSMLIKNNSNRSNYLKISFIFLNFYKFYISI